MVLDQPNNWAIGDTVSILNQYYAHSWEIYIGNKPLWSENPKCPGGPRLRADYKDYYDEFGSRLAPAFGFEAWCNMSGQFTFFVATGLPSEEVSICSVGVFGTSYIRS